MEGLVSQIAFWVLALIIAVCSVLTVVSRRILRSAVYLLFTLIATAGLYLLLDYHFLAAVQVAVYAGGIMVLLVFSIYLTGEAGQKIDILPKKKILSGVVAAFSGLALLAFVILKNADRWQIAIPLKEEINVSEIGHSLMSSGESGTGYLLPFVTISIFLLACVIGGILIARKR